MNIIKTQFGDAEIIERYNLDYVYEIIEFIVKENNIDKNELTYKKGLNFLATDEEGDSMYDFFYDIGGHRINMYRTILFYHIGETCVLTNVTYNNYTLFRTLDNNKVHFQLFYNDEFDNPLTLDHIDPVSVSKNNHISNLQPMSLKLNKMKSNRSNDVMQELVDIYGYEYVKDKYAKYGNRQRNEDDGTLDDIIIEFVGMSVTKIIDETKFYYKQNYQTEYSRGEIICRKIQKVIKDGFITYSIVMVMPPIAEDDKFDILKTTIKYIYNHRNKFPFLYNNKIADRFRVPPRLEILDDNIINIIFG